MAICIMPSTLYILFTLLLVYLILYISPYHGTLFWDTVRNVEIFTVCVNLICHSWLLTVAGESVPWRGRHHVAVQSSLTAGDGWRCRRPAAGLLQGRAVQWCSAHRLLFPWEAAQLPVVTVHSRRPSDYERVSGSQECRPQHHAALWVTDGSVSLSTVTEMSARQCYFSYGFSVIVSVTVMIYQLQLTTVARHPVVVPN